MTYKQPTKQLVRVEALTHAVEVLTSRRESGTIVPADFVSKVVTKLSCPEGGRNDNYAAAQFRSDDIKSWQDFRESAIGKRAPSDLTVAYLAGPEPTNDLKTLIKLGVRPENIWAFEVDEGVFHSAHADITKSELRGVKLINVSIEDYFLATPRRFDIIYFDACGPLPSHDQKTTRILTNIFRHSALTPLGVLITNFSAPDTSKSHILENYAHLVSAYLYPKSFLDTFDDADHTYTDGAGAHGYSLFPYEPTSDEFDTPEHEREDDKIFLDAVKERFSDYYGSFITRHTADIASIIAPSVRLLNGGLAKEIVTSQEEAIARARKFLEISLEPENDSSDAQDEHVVADMGGDAITEPEFYSLLFTMAACGLFQSGVDFSSVSTDVEKFCRRWSNQLSGRPDAHVSALDAVLCFYSLRHDEAFWATSVKQLADFDYGRMPFLCDVPTSELAFYPAFAQLAYPAHNNVAETKRYRYVAEGKSTEMFLDVVPFDECRYVYDWLSTAPLADGDWTDLSRQLVFRATLDAIAKNKRWYQDDFLYGCHVVGIDSDYFDPPMYELRKAVVAP